MCSGVRPDGDFDRLVLISSHMWSVKRPDTGRSDSYFVRGTGFALLAARSMCGPRYRVVVDRANKFPPYFI